MKILDVVKIVEGKGRKMIAKRMSLKQRCIIGLVPQ